MAVELAHSELTEKIIAAFYEVYNTLRYGFLEKVYENAFAIALRKRGPTVQQQSPINVRFQGEIVGEYFTDLYVNDLVIVEIKSAQSISDAHKAQLLNYLKATDKEIRTVIQLWP